MNLPALIVGVFVVFVVGRALVIGSASAGGESLRREDEPALYWSVITAGVAIAIFLLYLGISGRQ
jgi:hypothetical protein